MGKKWIIGKNIVISGASGGIGFHIAKILATKYFCNIIGVGRTKEKLENAKNQIDFSINETYEKRIKNVKRKEVKKGSFDYELFDVSSFENWQTFKSKLKERNFKIDILINNAGIMLPFDKFENQDLEAAKKVMETNFYSSLYSYKVLIDELKASKGSIINISSSAALCPVIGTAMYSASKAALKNFTEAIREEHKKELYVAYVCPGYTKTELFRNEKEISKLVDKFSSKADVAARKIVKRIVKKRKRIVLGVDAHLMSGFYRLCPKTAPSLVSWVLKTSKDKMFEKLFK